jgi:hypothetical protein
MTSQELNNIWNYYLSLEQDISNTSRYIEPDGQEDVHSFEFAKLLILACTEVESVFKAICLKISGEQPPADIGKYKEMILGHYPKIIEASVTVNRLGKEIKPFQEWSKGPLSWWGAYQEVKHSRNLHFDRATYRNAVNAIAALYVAIFYLAKIEGIDFSNYISSYISSKYSSVSFRCAPSNQLPDFEVTS